MRKIVYALTTTLVLGSAPASAGFYSGNDLWEICSSDGSFEKGLCMGLVVGVIQGTPSCNLPVRTTTEQVIDVVKKHLQDNPALRHRALSEVIVVAIRSLCQL